MTYLLPFITFFIAYAKLPFHANLSWRGTIDISDSFESHYKHDATRVSRALSNFYSDIHAPKDKSIEPVKNKGA